MILNLFVFSLQLLLIELKNELIKCFYSRLADYVVMSTIGIGDDTRSCTITLKERMRTVYFAAIDNTVDELEHRFSERGLQVC